MSYAENWKPAPPFFPMPNTGTILDISAGFWVDGHKDQRILNGGFALFWCIAALPNMFKSVLAAYCSGCVLRAFDQAVMHVHDTETTIVEERVERMTRLAMNIKVANYRIPENLIDEGRMFFTSSVDYNATELLNMVKSFAKKRLATEKQIELEIINPKTKKPYLYYNPVIEFWDSLSGMKAESAETMLEDGDVGTKDLNMLAMRVNMGKSQIVEQAPDLTAKHGIYLLTTAHVGQQYQLDPHKPNVKTLKFLKGEVKLKRVPENLSFQTGNCYVISGYSQLATSGMPDFPHSPGEDQKSSDLIELKLVNMRGKFGPSGDQLTIVVSQKEGVLPYLSNFLYLKDNDRFGLLGSVQNYSLALMPEYSMRRTNLRTKFRESFQAQRACQVLMEMHYMFTRWESFDEALVCEPTQLYEEIKAMGYDWNLLLDTRFWFSPIADSTNANFLSTYDLLNMRVGKYHPYWYPVKQKDLVKVEIKPTVEKSKSK